REREIDAAIAAWCAAHSCPEVLAAMEAQRVPAGPIYSVRDMFEDPHFRARGLFERVEIDGKPLEIPAMMPRLRGTPGETQWAGGPVDSHAEEILGGLLGLPAEEIAGLRRDGVV
ncbi:MAG: CoA transferase, partial [Gammaproteobacteria bacterium]